MLLGVLVPLVAGLLVAALPASGQEAAPTPDQLRAYGDMLGKYDHLFGAALQNFDDELRGLRVKNATPGELQQAYERFRQVSLELDRQYKQPVQEALVAEANRRVGQSGSPGTVLSDPRRPVSPSSPIKASSGTGPNDPNYRPWGADLDAVGGSRAIDHLGQVAHDMGLSDDDGNRLFERTPAYSTTDVDRFDVTMHKAGPLDRVGSNGWQTQIEVDATLKETALHVNMSTGQAGRDYVAVRDHHSKARSGLETQGVDLLPGAGQGVNLEGAAKLQGMVKGTLKSVNAANLSDADLARLIQTHGIGESPAKLRNVLNALKSGLAITPDAAGLTADNINKFQALCGDLIDTSAQVTKARATAELEERLALRDQLEATGDQADRERARQIREEIIDSRKRMQEVDRAVVRREIEGLEKQRDALATAADDGRTKPPAPAEAEVARRQKLAEIDREIDARRAREALRDLCADVERRKSVRGTSVVADLERPRSSRFQGLSRVNGPEIPELPPTQRSGLLTNPVVSRGLMIGGTLIATYQGAKDEYYEAEKRIRDRLQGTPEADRRISFNEVVGEISYTRAAGRTILSLTGVEGAWLAGQKAKYEFVKGTNDYIDAEIEREARIQRALGRPEHEISVGKAVQLAVKATIRQTTMTAYEGAKGIPLLGDVVGAPENWFLVTEATIGVFYDRWKRDQILAANAEQAIQDARQASRTVEKLLGDMHNLIAAARLQTEALERLRQYSLDAEQQAELLREQFRADFQALEALVPELGGDLKMPPALPETQEIGKLLSALTTYLRESHEFEQRCDRLERDLRSGKIDCSVIRSQSQDLVDQLATLEFGRDHIQADFESLQKSRQLLGPAADARQRALRLRETTIAAGRISEHFTRTAASVKQLAEHLRTLRANLDLVRERVMSIHEKFSPRAAPADAADWDRYLRQADDSRIDIAAGSSAGAIEERLAAAAAHLGLLSRTELPQLPPALEPRRISGQLSGDLEDLKAPLAAMQAASQKAADKLDGLQQLCPVPKSAFTVTAKTSAGLSVQFEVTGTKLAAGAQRTYCWDFGDETKDAVPQGSRSHTYQKPGQYTVSVLIFEETEKFSAEIGAARTTVTVAGEPTPNERTSGSPAFELVRGITFEIDGVKKRPGPGSNSVPDTNDINRGVSEMLFRDRSVGEIEAGASGTLYFSPTTNRMRCELTSGYATIYTSEGIPMLQKLPFYHVNFSGTAEGPWNPQTGEFTLTFAEAQGAGAYREERGGIMRRPGEEPNYHTPEERNAAAAVIRNLGYDADSLSWRGTISGRYDWKGFQGGSARLELNRLIRGSWTDTSVEGYGVVVPGELRMIGGRPRHVTVALYRDEELAQQRLRWPIYRPVPQEFADLADEVRETRQSGPPRYAFRHGRFFIEATVVPPGSASREQLQEFLDRLCSFLESR